MKADLTSEFAKLAQRVFKFRMPSALRRAPATTVARKNPSSRVVTLLAGLCLLLVGGLIFRRFLFGRAVLLYTDIGSDSLFYHAYFLHLSNYIRSQGFPSWSFYDGMGQDLAYITGYLVWEPVSWLPSRLIAPALVFQHLGKVLVAGLFSTIRWLRYSLHRPILKIGLIDAHPRCWQWSFSAT